MYHNKHEKKGGTQKQTECKVNDEISEWNLEPHFDHKNNISSIIWNALHQCQDYVFAAGFLL